MRKDNADLESAAKKLEEDVTSFKAQVLTDNNEFAELSRKHNTVVKTVDKKNKTLKEKLALYAELQKINKQLGANVAYRQRVAELERQLASSALLPKIRAEKAKLAALKRNLGAAGNETAKKTGQAVNLVAELATHKAIVDDAGAWRKERASLENEIHVLEGWLDGNRTLSKTIHDQLNATIGQLNKKKALTASLKYKLQSMPKVDVYGVDSPKSGGKITKESMLAKLALLKPMIAQWDTIHGLEEGLQNVTALASQLDYEAHAHLSRATKSKARLEAKARKLRKDVDALQGSMSSVREGLGDIVSR